MYICVDNIFDTRVHPFVTCFREKSLFISLVRTRTRTFQRTRNQKVVNKEVLLCTIVHDMDSLNQKRYSIT
jgi:hypothetical protein